MTTIGLDLHKRESQLCIGFADGRIEQRRIATTLERARILVEASTESEWVRRHLESLGHEVIVADPNFAPMYATRSRGTKSDKRDARALMEACRLGAYRRAPRVSAARRHVRAELAVRDALVRTRTRYLGPGQGVVRRAGLRVASSHAEYAAQRIAALDLDPLLQGELAPLFALLTPLNEQIRAADARIAAIGESDPAVALLMSVPSIGPVTATTVVATVDDVARFASAHQFEAYLELVPSEHSSGEKRRLGAITKACNLRVRVLLVEAVADPAFVETRERRAARVGTEYRRSPRTPHCGGRAGASTGGCALRGLA